MAILTSTLPKPTSGGERPADLRASNANFSVQEKSHVGSPAWLRRAVLHAEGATAEMAPSPSNTRCESTRVTLGWASKLLVTTYSCPSIRMQNFCPISCSNMNLSLTHHSLSSPSWISSPTVDGHPSLASHAIDYSVESL